MNRTESNHTQAVLDAALELLAPYGPDLKNGMTDHTPMVAGALCDLNRPEAVSPWVEKQIPQIKLRLPSNEPILDANWRPALGDPDRSQDWFEFFHTRLERARLIGPFLDTWIQTLAPGMSAAAVHGVIRTGYAVRAISQAATPARRRELADALALWAANYLELPTSRQGLADAGLNATPIEALRGVPLMPEAKRSFDGTIVGCQKALKDHAGFAPVIHWIDVSEDLAGRLDQLTECFARVFLANARDTLTAIVFVHGVTGAAALRPILPYIEERTAAAAVKYVWQAGCGLFAAFATSHNLNADQTRPIDPASREKWIDRAVAGGDDHVIKFTATCLDEFDRGGSQTFLRAIRLAHQILQPENLCESSRDK